jgi:zinc ribbon protein
MSENVCPHCGEPLDDDATFCPHCGSDEETGWKPDTDYYAVELPEEDDEADAEAAPSPGQLLGARLKALVGPALVVAAWVLFVVYGLTKFEKPLLVLVPAVYLAVTIGLVARVASRQSRARPRT